MAWKNRKANALCHLQSDAQIFILQAEAYLEIGRDEAEVKELEGHPELPVGNHSCLPVLLQLALNLV